MMRPEWLSSRQEAPTANAGIPRGFHGEAGRFYSKDPPRNEDPPVVSELGVSCMMYESKSTRK